MKDKDTIRLTPKQKEVIQRIRNGDKGTVYYGDHRWWFEGNWQPHPNIIKAMLKHGMIEIVTKKEVIVHYNRSFKLTKKFKTINLEGGK